jgi:hypothetical protein
MRRGEATRDAANHLRAARWHVKSSRRALSVVQSFKKVAETVSLRCCLIARSRIVAE